MTTVLTEANIYIGKSLFGQLKDFQAPEVEITTIENKTVGGIGSLNLPVGVKLGDCNMTLTGFDKDVYKSIANPFDELNITIRGNLREYNGQQFVGENPVKMIIRGNSKKFSQLGKFQSQENVEQTIDINPTATRLEQNGEVLSEVDIVAPTWKVDGVDMLAKALKNMGLS